MAEELCGQVERVTFNNAHTGFTVAKILCKKTLVCIVGKMPPLQPGERVRCKGKWSVSPVHGKQFSVESVTVAAPAGMAGIQKYLESGMIRGIGKVYASKIVSHFGEETLAVLDETPSRLLEVAGIGKKRVRELVRAWEEQRTIRDVMILLQSYGISPAYAQRIYKEYGDEAANKVRENPYRLAREVVGIGFKRADQIASDLGIEKDSQRRLEAGIDYFLRELRGHTRYPIDDFVVQAAEMLEVVPQQIEELLPQQETIILSGGFVAQRALHMAEKSIAGDLERLKGSPCALRAVDAAKALVWVQEQLRIKLAKHQSDAVAQALSEKVQIITGGPGTGKSTITNAILRICSRLTERIALAAPTGRAAKRMSQITRREAKTIHSLLEVDFRSGGFKRGRNLPLTCDLLIIDEASMIDTNLMASLLKAIPSHARLILVGDINQLPSVGAGNVLKDLIASEKIATTQLTQIFRQAAGSRIITNAHRINEGKMPDLSLQENSDFYFVEQDDPQAAQAAIIGLVTHRIPKHYGFDEIQVLCPMKRGPIGTEMLNNLLQAKLNPGEGDFRVGDKVMQIRNNYDREVFNGDIGRILQIDQEITVKFDGKKVVYRRNDLDELQLAYAITVHKSQGSEYPCVVMPIHDAHFMMLQRNLLYTGVTRARKLVILVGSKRAVGMAVNNNEVETRHTGLLEALC